MAIPYSFFSPCSFLSIFICLFIQFLSLPGFVHSDEVVHSEEVQAPAIHKPNILLFITDDQSISDVKDFMPQTTKRIYEQGLEFERAYTSTPSCNASRASLLTGKYASEHGASGNRYVLSGDTIVNRLQSEAAYETAHIGKFLNSWNGEKRPEYDYWVSFPGGSYKYISPILNINGHWARTQGYITDIFADQALEFLRTRKQSAAQQPFFLTVSFTAPHAPSVPHPEDQLAFSDIPLPRPVHFNELDRSDKPVWLRDLSPLTPRAIAFADRRRIAMRRCLPAVDRAIDAILDELRTQEILNNTMVIFLSDNGMFHGEHGLANKDAVYEEAIRIPLAVRFPKVIPVGSTSRLTGLIDVAASILDAAGLTPDKGLSGSSFLQAADKEKKWRSYLFLESFRNGANRVAFSGVHTGRYVLVKNKTRSGTFDPNRYEFYDLKTDPEQLDNMFSHPAYRDIRNELMQVLRELLLAHRGRLNFTRPAAERLRKKPRLPRVRAMLRTGAKKKLRLLRPPDSRL